MNKSTEALLLEKLIEREEQVVKALSELTEITDLLIERIRALEAEVQKLTLKWTLT